MADKPVPKVKDIKQIVRYLSNTFNHVTSGFERAARTATGPNEAYRLQTEFAYLLNEVVVGPICMEQKNITACNEFIDEVMQRANRAEFTR